MAAKKLPTQPPRHYIYSDIDTLSPYDITGNITEVIKTLEEYVKKHGPDVSISHDYQYEQYSNGERFSEFSVRLHRLENDEEYNTRVAAHQRLLDDQEARERKLLADLKKKYKE